MDRIESALNRIEQKIFDCEMKMIVYTVSDNNDRKAIDRAKEMALSDFCKRNGPVLNAKKIFWVEVIA